jgi:hypothetical protein
MKKSLSEIKAMLAGITPVPWIYVYNGSSDWTVGEYPDAQAKPICTVWSKNDEWARAHVEFISVAPQIIFDLIEMVEAYEEVAIHMDRILLELYPMIDIGKAYRP